MNTPDETLLLERIESDLWRIKRHRIVIAALGVNLLAAYLGLLVVVLA